MTGAIADCNQKKAAQPKCSANSQSEGAEAVSCFEAIDSSTVHYGLSLQRAKQGKPADCLFGYTFLLASILNHIETMTTAKRPTSALCPKCTPNLRLQTF